MIESLSTPSTTEVPAQSAGLPRGALTTQAAMPVTAARPGNGNAHALSAVALLVIGLFVASIPCGLAAYRLSDAAMKHGSESFGGLMKVISVVYLIVAFIFFVIVMTSH